MLKVPGTLNPTMIGLKDENENSFLTEAQFNGLLLKQPFDRLNQVLTTQSIM